MTSFTLDLAGSKPITGVLELGAEIPPPIHPPLWIMREDKELFGYIRSCAPCPGVVVLKDDPHAIFNKQWQFFYRAINYNVPLRYISPNYGSALALFNGTGFPGRHNYITGADANEKDPNADKVRTFVRNVMTGTPRYSLTQAFREGAVLVRSIITRTQSITGFRKFFAALTTTNVLNVETFDSRYPPSLKSGSTYPQTVEEINIDDYEITPRTHRWRFCAENVVNAAGLVKPFDHGAVYDWMGDNNYYTFFPLISNHGWGDVLVPLRKLRRLEEGKAMPSPYRFS